jgi:hypothetical protein
MKEEGQGITTIRIRIRIAIVIVVLVGLAAEILVVAAQQGGSNENIKIKYILYNIIIFFVIRICRHIV